MVEKRAFVPAPPALPHSSRHPKHRQLSARRAPTAQNSDGSAAPPPNPPPCPRGTAKHTSETTATGDAAQLQGVQTDVFGIDVDRLASDPEENLRGFVKTRGSLVPGQEFVFWFCGEVHGVVDGHGSRHLFGIEGYNIGRMMRVDGGWRLVTREVAVYREGDSSGPIMHVWKNPYTEGAADDDDDNDEGGGDGGGGAESVVHVWNDPVNQELLLDGPYGKFRVGATRLDDTVCWNIDAFPRYESPLPSRLFPDVGGGDIYEAAEMIQLFAPAADLADAKAPAVRACALSWTRVGPWLPWMRMGDRPGRLVYHCRGRKVGSFAQLPAELRAFVLRAHPEYAQAPDAFSRPNETSWSYMRKLLDARGRPRADGRVAPPEPEPEADAAAAAAAAPHTVPLAAARGARLSLTARELRRFDGRDGAPLYVSVLGRVFDVGSARRHYGVGQTYHCLAGRDATRALVSGNLSGECGVDRGGHAIDVRRLSASQRETVDGWLSFFGEHYPEVGLLSDLE